jgi:hypothetical protein
MSPEEKDQKIERLELENQDLRQKIAELVVCQPKNAA